MSKPQLDMFASQDDMFPSEPVVYRANPDRVRRRLDRILAEAREATSMPWDRARQRFYQTVVPQMTLWLPDEEAAQYRLAFQEQLSRLN